MEPSSRRQAVFITPEAAAVAVTKTSRPEAQAAEVQAEEDLVLATLYRLPEQRIKVAAVVVLEREQASAQQEATAAKASSSSATPTLWPTHPPRQDHLCTPTQADTRRTHSTIQEASPGNGLLR